MASCCRCKLTANGMAFLLLFVYLFIGMALFYILESPVEQAIQRVRLRATSQLDTPIENVTVDLLPSNFTRNFLQTSGSNFSEINATALGAFLRRLGGQNNLTQINFVAATFVSPTKAVIFFRRINIQALIELANTAGNRKWNFVGAFFFSVTVVSTIGYGNLAPLTNAGKLACVLYAIPGIPLASIVMDLIRHFFENFALWLRIRAKRTVRWIVTTFRRQRSSLARMINRNVTSSSSTQALAAATEATPRAIDADISHPQPWLVVISFICGWVFMVTLPAAIFWYMEGWDYLSAVYYNYVTLTTIGFGDLIAGNNNGSPKVRYNNETVSTLYRMFLSVWVLLGLPFFYTFEMMIRSLIQRFLRWVESRTCCQCSSPCCRRKTEPAEMTSSSTASEEVNRAGDEPRSETQVELRLEEDKQYSEQASSQRRATMTSLNNS